MIWGIYLAAGQSKRMGCPKLSLPLGESLLGSIALQTAMNSTLNGIVLVTREGDSLDWVPPHFYREPFRGRWIHSPCRTSLLGQSESLKSGLRTAQQLHAQAVMILLADQPFVSVEMINHIISLYAKRPVNYITACHKGIVRPPVIFDSSVFPKLLQLQGDEGARRLIRGCSTQGITVNYTDARPFIDVDTINDYQSLIEI